MVHQPDYDEPKVMAVFPFNPGIEKVYRFTNKREP